MRLATTLIATLVASAFSIQAQAVTLIPAASRTDMVHDVRRGIVYVANGTEIVRYDVNAGMPLSPITLRGNLGGIAHR